MASNLTTLVYMDAASPTGEPRPATLELVTAARAVGRVDVVALAAPSTHALATLGAYGVGAVHQAALPESVPPDARSLPFVAAAVLEAAVRRVHADLLLVPTTFAAKEAAAIAAARLDAGFVANGVTIGLDADSRQLRATTVAFAGTWHVVMALPTDPAIVALQPGGVVPEPAAVPMVPEVYPLPVECRAPLVEVVSRVAEPRESDRPELEDAAVVVAGGRGLGEDLAPLFELADALGAAVGVTRDVAFDGLFDRYIGTTGVTVAPRLYIAAGISGSPYHTGGMRGSKLVVSINNDDDAPINELADLVIVGDVAAVLPEAAELVRLDQ